MRSAEHRDRLLSLRREVSPDGRARGVPRLGPRLVPGARPRRLAAGADGRARRRVRPPSSRPGSPSCAQAGYAVPALAGRVGRRHVHGRAGRAVLRSSPPTTPRGWCWPSSPSTTRPPRCSRPAPTSSAAATCRPSSTARSGSRASPSPRPGPTWPASRTTARREGDAYLVNGQKLWASGAMHADWCLLLARTDPAAPKRARHLLLPAGHADPRDRRPPDPPGDRRVVTSARSSSTTS